MYVEALSILESLELHSLITVREFGYANELN